MHKKILRRKSRLVMEMLDQKKKLQLHQIDKKRFTVEENRVTANQIDDAEEENFSSSCSSKKMKVCSSKAKQKKYTLLSFQELPEYMKDNEFIFNYYRTEWPLKEAFFSLFHWHNETLNVWTHLLGFVLFLGLTIANVIHFPEVADFITMFTSSTVKRDTPHMMSKLKGFARNRLLGLLIIFGIFRHFPASADTNVSHNSKDFSLGPTKLIDLKQEPALQMDITSPEMASTSWPFFIFLGGSMFCLLSSSACHLFSCHSQRLNLLLLQMDYVGITVMIITSFFPPIYYIFQCSPHWQLVYLIGVTIMGICTVITLLTPAFSTGKYRAFRAILFMSMGFFGLIPAIHAVVVNWNDPQRNIILCYEGVMAMSYITGTMFYISRIPERWKPGFFDLTGHSHQIFHVFVIMGALAHYGAAKIFLQYRSRLGCDN